MELPDKHPCLIGSDIWTERLAGRTTKLFADEPMREIIKAARLTGIFEWFKCPSTPPPWLDKWKASGGRYLPPADSLKSLKQTHPPYVISHPDSIANLLIEFADASVADEIETMLADPRYQDMYEILRKA